MKNKASVVLKTSSDMGDIKIFGNELSCFFANGCGDGLNTVRIYTKKYKNDASKFIGHFTVRDPHSISLSGYDCGDDSIYTFGIGRWFVYLIKPRVFDIILLEKDGLES